MELRFVLNEAVGPGFVDRKGGRLWLTSAGDALFRDSSGEPAIFSVEERRRDVGFDLLSIAPQQPRPIDWVEQGLPEMPIADAAMTGRVSGQCSSGSGGFSTSWRAP